jgi:membrane protein implicated in regulation of membrane protease activity
MAEEDDAVLSMPVRPGPTAILKRATTSYESDAQLQDDLQLAASLVVRFGRKIKEGSPEGEIRVSLKGESWSVTALPLDDSLFQGWALE